MMILNIWGRFKLIGHERNQKNKESEKQSNNRIIQIPQTNNATHNSSSA